MFTVKNIQDKLKQRRDDVTSGGHNDGEMVASGLLCPNCRVSFTEIEQLMQHVPTCTGQVSASMGDNSTHVSSSPVRQPQREQNRTGSQSSSSIFSAASFLNGTRDSSNDTVSTSSSPRPNSPNPKQSEAKLLKLAQENVRWKEKCDELGTLVESLTEQLNNGKLVLTKKNKYIEKLESDILKYEETADDSMAIKNELSSLQQLVSSMSTEHETEINDLLEKLHKSQEKNLQLTSELETKHSKLAGLETESGNPIEMPKNEAFTQTYQTDSAAIETAAVACNTEAEDHGKEAEISDVQTQDSILTRMAKELEDVKSSRDSTIMSLQQQIEQLEAAASKGCMQCKEYELQLKKTQKTHSTEVSQLENKVQSLEMRILEQSSAVEQAETMRQTLSGELNEKKQELIASMQQIHNLEASVQLQQEENQKLSETIARLEELPEENERLVKKIDHLEGLLEAKIEEAEKLYKDRENMRNEKKELEIQLENVEKSLFECQHANSLFSHQLQQQKTELTKQIDTLRNNISAVRMELSEKEEVTEEQLSRLNQNLTLLRSDLNSKEEEVAEYESKVEKLQTDLSQKTDETAALKDSLFKANESLQAKNQEFDRLKTHYVELRASLEGAQRVMFELGREQQSLQVERARMLDRNWLPDHHVTHCLSCSKEFSATLRKHHCRCCGKIFCNDCSAKRASLPAHPTPVRVCNECSQLFPPTS